MSSTAGDETNWRMVMELCDSMNPTQNSDNQFEEIREQRGTCRRDGVGLVLHRCSCKDNCKTAWASPKAVLAKVFVLLAEVPPFRDLCGVCRRALPPTPQASHWTYDHIEE